MANLGIILSILTLAACLPPLSAVNAQARTVSVASQKDSLEVAIELGKYIRASFPGSVAFDSSLTCLNGLLCAENEHGANSAREAQRRRIHAAVRSAAGGKIIPFRSGIAVCTSPHSENCRLKTDFYIRIWEPRFSNDSASISFNVAGNTRSLTENRIYTEQRSAVFAKTTNRWILKSVVVTSVR